MFEVATGDAWMCGDDTSGRMRICAVRDDETKKRPPHFTLGRSIDFSAKVPTRLYSEMQYPVMETAGRSIYIPAGPGTHQCEHCIVQTQTKTAHVAHMKEHQSSAFLSQSSHGDDMTTRELFKEYREDPHRIEHKQREKRKRELDREEESAARKTQDRKRDPYACCKLPGQPPIRSSLDPELNCIDWLFHDGNAHYASDRNVFVAFKSLDALAHLSKKPSEAEGLAIRQHIAVAGVGTVILKVKVQVDSDAWQEIQLSNVLWLPQASCNGISRSLLGELGYYVEEPMQNPGRCFSLVPAAGLSAPRLCGTTASGVSRLLFSGDNASRDETTDPAGQANRHFVVSADMEMFNWKDDRGFDMPTICKV